MQSSFHLFEIMKELKHGELYHEFLRVPSMSAGIYQLKKGETDKQSPHTEDEIYYVVQGLAEIQVGEENLHVKQGSIIFVKANIEHRFHSITEDLTLLVFFSPSEYTNKIHDPALR